MNNAPDPNGIPVIVIKSAISRYALVYVYNNYAEGLRKRQIFGEEEKAKIGLTAQTWKSFGY